MELERVRGVLARETACDTRSIGADSRSRRPGVDSELWAEAHEQAAANSSRQPGTQRSAAGPLPGEHTGWQPLWARFPDYARLRLLLRLSQAWCETGSLTSAACQATGRRSRSDGRPALLRSQGGRCPFLSTSVTCLCTTQSSHGEQSCSRVQRVHQMAERNGVPSLHRMNGDTEQQGGSDARQERPPSHCCCGEDSQGTGAEGTQQTKNEWKAVA